MVSKFRLNDLTLLIHNFNLFQFYFCKRKIIICWIGQFKYVRAKTVYEKINFDSKFIDQLIFTEKFVVKVLQKNFIYF